MTSNFRVGGVDTDDIFIRREIFQEGGLWLWGRNSSGQVGDNSSTVSHRSSPVQTVSGGTNWFQISCNPVSTSPITAAIKSDGTLWVWGENGSGGVGDNTAIPKSSPVQTVSGGTNWRQVSVGNLTAAIKTDGTLWVWGRNANGQLGDNTAIARSSPVQTISGGTNWKQVSAGGYSTAAIKTDGTLWTWGLNDKGQLGTNDTANRSSPVQTVSGGTNWRQVSIGEGVTGAIKTDGTLWAWGWNYGGSLGEGTSLSRSSPVQILGGGTNWKKVSMNRLTASAIKTDGTLWTWGFNQYGNLGTNDRVSRSSPVQTIAGGTDWKQAETGEFYIIAIKTDGTLWTWGTNQQGRLGTNDAINRSSPVQTIAGGTNWRKISGGYAHCGGIREDFY